MPGSDDLEICDPYCPESSGFSNETVLFTARWSEGGEDRQKSMVARMQPIGPGLFPSYDIHKQFRIMKTLWEHTDVPVARMLWMEENRSVLDGPFFVMERVDGLIPPDDPVFTQEGWVLELSESDRRTMYVNALEALAAIHSTDWSVLDLGDLARGLSSRSSLEREIRYYKGYYSWATGGRSIPTIDAGFDWVMANLPTNDGNDVLVWGDARIGNMIFRKDLTVAAVLDWEMACLANREMDLGYWLFILRYQTEGSELEMPAGFLTTEEMVDHYASVTGHEPRNLHFYEAFAALRGSVIAARLVEMMKGAGMLPADSDMAENTIPIRMLARIVGLPSPVGPGLGAFSKKP